MSSSDKEYKTPCLIGELVVPFSGRPGLHVDREEKNKNFQRMMVFHDPNFGQEVGGRLNINLKPEP